MIVRTLLGLLPVAALALMAGPGTDGEKDAEKAPEPPPPPKPNEEPEAPPIVRKHKVRVGDKTLQYYTTVGMMPIKNAKGETEAKLFFTAYTLDSEEGDRDRPLMFSFNGGPGSSSVWLHLGGLGPRRVEMLDDGAMPPPPYKLVENEFTWLEETDLVFVDPVDTGYSRATTPELAKEFCGVDKDLEAVGEFIRLYLTRYKRWSSPLFMVGESYGTFRAAGLAGHLIEKGIAFNGIVLVSSILSMQTARFGEGNDLPYILFLPTYAATAWRHKKLAPDLQNKPLPEFLKEVEAWAEGEYANALGMGSRLSAADRTVLADRLARYTGLSMRYVENANLRIQIHRFCKELLRDQGLTVGRLDSRYTGYDGDGVAETGDFDPSMTAIRPPYTAMLNDYVRSDLGFESDTEYHILRGLEWNWGSAGSGHPQTSAALSAAFQKNPYLHLFIASGYYDLATPYFATKYTVSHMALDSAARANVRGEEYPVGHMVYLEKETLRKLQTDVNAFVRNAIGVPGKRLRT